MFRMAEDLVALIKKNRVANPGQFAKAPCSPSLTQELLEQLETQIHQQDVNKNLNIFFQIDQYTQSKINKVTPDALRAYRNLKTYLMAFQEYQKTLRGRTYGLRFEDLDFNFYEEFVGFLSYQCTPLLRTTGIPAPRQIRLQGCTF